MFCPNCGRYSPEIGVCSTCRVGLISSGSEKSELLLGALIERAFRKGWLPVTREGSTGLGKAWEDALGIEENNLSRADFGNVEVKALEYGESTPLTLVAKAVNSPTRPST